MRVTVCSEGHAEMAFPFQTWQSCQDEGAAMALFHGALPCCVCRAFHRRGVQPLGFGGGTPNVCVCGGVTSSVCGGVTSSVGGGVTSSVCGGVTSSVCGGVTSSVGGGVTSSVCGGVTSSVGGYFKYVCAGYLLWQYNLCT